MVPKTPLTANGVFILKTPVAEETSLKVISGSLKTILEGALPLHILMTIGGQLKGEELAASLVADVRPFFLRFSLCVERHNQQVSQLTPRNEGFVCFRY